MADIVKRAIVILSKCGGLELIEGLRQRFDPLQSKIGAHITLVFPFESELSADRLRAHIRRAIHGMTPFEVHLQGITGHEAGYLFLNVTLGSDELIEMHDRLYSGPLAPYLVFELPYVPHVTVGRLPDRDKLLDALEVAREVSATFQTVVSEIHVYRIELDGNLVEEFGVNLCGREAGQ